MPVAYADPRRSEGARALSAPVQPPAPRAALVPPAPQPQLGAVGRGGEDAVARTVYHPQGSSLGPVVGVLVGVEGKLSGEIFALRDGENSLGRDPKCEVRFPERDPRISRRHAQIVHSGGLFAIRPLSAENPTHVNRERIEDVTELPDRAQVSIGASEFRFLAVSA